MAAQLSLVSTHPDHRDGEQTVEKGLPKTAGKANGCDEDGWIEGREEKRWNEDEKTEDQPRRRPVCVDLEPVGEEVDHREGDAEHRGDDGKEGEELPQVHDPGRTHECLEGSCRGPAEGERLIDGGARNNADDQPLPEQVDHERNKCAPKNRAAQHAHIPIKVGCQ